MRRTMSRVVGRLAPRVQASAVYCVGYNVDCYCDHNRRLVRKTCVSCDNGTLWCGTCDRSEYGC